MNELNFINKPFNTSKYEKSLIFHNKPFINKLLSTIGYPFLGLFISLSLSFLILVFNIFAGFLNLIFGGPTSMLSVGSYIIINTFIPLFTWGIALYKKNKTSKALLKNKLAKQKYLANRLVELYNNRLKLLLFLEKDKDRHHISEKEIPHIRQILKDMLPKIEAMKKNIELHTRNKEFFSKFSLEKEGIYKVFEEFRDLDRQMSAQSKQTIEQYIDDAYIFEAFENLEKDMKSLENDPLDMDILDEKP